MRTASPLRGSGGEMLIKAVSLFLLGMVVLAMFGRLRFPKRKSDGGLAKKLEKPALCGKCGRYIIGSGECDCTKPPASKG